MQSRGERASSQITNPPETASGTPQLHPQSVQDHNFYLQCVMEIQRSIGKLEASVASICTTTEKQAAKLESMNGEIHELSKEVHGAKRVAWILGGIGSVIGAIGLVFLNKILDVVVAYVGTKLPGH